MAEREQTAYPRKLYDNPIRQLVSDIIAAERRAAAAQKAKQGKEAKGPFRPSERIAGATLMAAFGLAGESIVRNQAAPFAEKYKLGSLDALPRWMRETIFDGVTTGAYLFVRKHLGDELPQVKLPDLAGSFASNVVGDVVGRGAGWAGLTANRAVKGVREAIGRQAGKFDMYLSTEPENSKVKQALGPVYRGVPLAADWLAKGVNPVTIGAGREAWQAFRDIVTSYRDVVAGVPEKPEVADEPVHTKETTIVILGNEGQLTSALETVSAESGTATSS